MLILKNIKILFIIHLTYVSLTMKIYSDEGMWTPDNLPLLYLKEKYNFTPPAKLLKKIQLSSVRFNDGGSGAFVSQKGLVLTNHHVAMGQLQKISNKKNDYVKNGFLAKSPKEELKCPDLELNILLETENVTQKIKEYLLPYLKSSELELKRKEIISKIEKDSYEKTGYRSDVVELYHGGEFWLYKYLRYTDIRLVHAPELQAAAFGGDGDNFQYPRYALDYAFFRVYQNNKPIESKNFLQWNSNGAKENELLFVSGHPGSTDRQKTLSEILFLKDHSFPEYLKILNEKIHSMREYSKRGKEEERRAKGSILGMENSIKALEGEYNALKDEKTIEIIKKNEDALQQIVNNSIDLKNEYGEIWNHIKSVQDKMIERKKEMYYQNFSGQLPSLALSLVRYQIELEKPNEKRYEEFRDSSLESIRFKLLTSAPVYKDKEIVSLSKSLELSLKELGKENEYIKLALGDRDPKSIATEIIENTKLDSSEFRQSLLQNPKLIQNSNDPLLLWIIKLEPLLRKNRDWIEKEIENVMTVEGGKLAELRFKVYGRNTYPDATFTLRLSIGTTKQYEIDGWKVPPFTTFSGLYERAYGFNNKSDYKLSEKISKSINNINSNSKLNFCTTHDITGGNSGSPVINTKGEIVGLIFDGNAYSHTLSYIYTDEKARAISVHTEGIEEALRSIYSASYLIKELKAK